MLDDLKTLRGLTPYEYICKTWTERANRFITDPTHHTVGPTANSRCFRKSVFKEGSGRPR